MRIRDDGFNKHRRRLSVSRPQGCELYVNQLTLTGINQVGRHLERDCASGMSNANLGYGGLCMFTIGSVGYCVDEIAIRNRILQRALSGRRIACKALVKPANNTELGFPPESRVGKSTLRIARNAVFSRHGRRLKRRDLQDYFYGPDAARLLKGMVLTPNLGVNSKAGYPLRPIEETSRVLESLRKSFFNNRPRISEVNTIASYSRCWLPPLP